MKNDRHLTTKLLQIRRCYERAKNVCLTCNIDANTQQFGFEGNTLKNEKSTHSWIAHELQVETSLGRRHNLVRFQI